MEADVDGGSEPDSLSNYAASVRSSGADDSDIDHWIGYAATPEPSPAGSKSPSDSDDWGAYEATCLEEAAPCIETELREFQQSR